MKIVGLALAGLLIMNCVIDPETVDAVKSGEPPLTHGTYTYSLTVQDGETSAIRPAPGTYTHQLELKADGTLLLDQYLASSATGNNKVQTFQMKGEWKQTSSAIQVKNAMIRTVNAETGGFNEWQQVPGGGEAVSVIRNVTDTSFEEYSADEKKWWSWKKL